MVEVPREDESDPERPDDLDDHAELGHTRPITLAPVMLSVVWIARRTIVIRRIVVWFVGSQFVSNQLCESCTT